MKLDIRQVPEDVRYVWAMEWASENTACVIGREVYEKIKAIKERNPKYFPKNNKPIENEQS